MRGFLSEMESYIAGRSIEWAVERSGLPRDKVIKLNSNEHPLGPSPEVIEALKGTISHAHHYPSGGGLLRELAEYSGYPEKNIVIGAGMDGVIDTMLSMYLDNNDEVMIPIPTFSYYDICAIKYGIPRYIGRSKGFGIDPDMMLEGITNRTKVVILCSPNNPSGNSIDEATARTLAEGFDGVVLIDEAYVEFAEKSLIHLVREYDNLVVMRTMSKAFALAGLRIGYACLPIKLAEGYNKVNPPFSVGSLGIAAGIAALKDKRYLKETIRMICEGRAYLIDNIRFKVYPSEANFVLVDTSPMNSSEVADLLAEKGILIRDCSSFKGMGDHFIRCTVGTDEENAALTSAMEDIVG